MASNTSQILMIGFAFLSSVIGIFFDILLSRKRISALHRGIEICDKIVYEQFNMAISTITVHFKNEINRILEIPIREISSLIHSFGKNKRNVNFDIQGFDVKDLEIDFLKSFKNIQQTNLFIRKLESAANRIRIFRWLFGILLTVVLLLGFFLIVWPKLVPAWISIAALIISIMSFIIFLFDSIQTNDLIDKTEKEYGLSIGE